MWAAYTGPSRQRITTSRNTTPKLSAILFCRSLRSARRSGPAPPVGSVDSSTDPARGARSSTAGYFLNSTVENMM